MKKSRHILIILPAILVPLGLALTYAAQHMQYLTERFYSNIVFKFIGQALNAISGIFPFSVGELIIVLLVLWCLWSISNLVITLLKGEKSRRETLVHFLFNVGAAVSIIYFCFVITWGLCYYRLPFSAIAGLDVHPASTNELEQVCSYIVDDANRLRGSVSESSKGTFYVPGGYRDIFSRAYKGYKKASSIYPELGGKYGKPKGVMLSELMSYAGICGVYFPFTGEANVNISMPGSLIPSTSCHEMAHQHGFSKEDEANYISYVTCMLNPDADFQYCGTLLALTYCMNSLYEYDRPGFMELSKKYGAGLKRDLDEINEYWAGYEGPVERVSSKVNDAYLKANMQSDGIQSYGRMVDLMIAGYRAKNGRTKISLSG